MGQICLQGTPGNIRDCDSVKFRQHVYSTNLLLMVKGTIRNRDLNNERVSSFFSFLNLVLSMELEQKIFNIFLTSP